MSLRVGAMGIALLLAGCGGGHTKGKAGVSEQTCAERFAGSKDGKAWVKQVFAEAPNDDLPAWVGASSVRSQKCVIVFGAPGATNAVTEERESFFAGRDGEFVTLDIVSDPAPEEADRLIKEEANAHFTRAGVLTLDDQ